MRPAKVLKEAFSAAGFAVGRLDIVLVYKKSSQAARWLSGTTPVKSWGGSKVPCLLEVESA
jgi:hypothetical protein